MCCLQQKRCTILRVNGSFQLGLSLDRKPSSNAEVIVLAMGFGIYYLPSAKALTTDASQKALNKRLDDRIEILVALTSGGEFSAVLLHKASTTLLLQLRADHLKSDCGPLFKQR